MYNELNIKQKLVCYFKISSNTDSNL